MMPMQDPPPDPTASVAALLEAHGAEIYRHLRRLSPAADDAADLHQETFLRAFRALPSLPADANHRAWLHRIAANAAADAHRRRAVRAAAHAGTGPGITRSPNEPGPGRDPDVGGAGTQAAGAAVLAEAEPSRDPAVDPVARAEASELRSAVRAALADLPWRERTAVVSRVLDGRDYADVAEALACSEANARQLVSRGIRHVRATLAPYLEIDR
jgi:RNA polymerase sigma-70 factor (ECF subfamily)